MLNALLQTGGIPGANAKPEIRILRGDRIDTNMVIFEIEPGLASASRFEIELQQLGVDCFAVGSQAVRLVTHLDISGDQIAQACTAIDRAVENCAIN